jgi:PEP-CTERM motif
MHYEKACFRQLPSSLEGAPIDVSSGDTNLAEVPEPGTPTLLGTGLIGLAGVTRRKLSLT